MQTVEERLRALMLESLAGDEVSYRRLLVEIGGRLRAYYGRRLGDARSEAEDLVQETLIAIHTRRLTYDRDRPFTAWLHAIARYKMIDHLRASRRRPDIPLDDVADLVGPDDAEAAVARLDLDGLLETIPERSRGFVRAVKLEGRSVAEVSAASGLSEGAVRVAVHRALKTLQDRLKARAP